MAVVIRLLGLNVKAGSQDIRRFFSGLHIPEGGVHIIGGSRGEAFIIFSSEMDGELALQHTGSILKGSRISLCLSSKVELHHKLVSSLKKYKPSETCPKERKSTTNKMPTSKLASELLVSLASVVEKLQKKNQTASEKSPSMSSVEDIPSRMTPAKSTLVTASLNTRYLCLRGVPSCTTKQEICSFFEGLQVNEVIINVKIGGKVGCLVKFASHQDAQQGLKYTRKNLGAFCVDVSEATQEAWLNAVETCRMVSLQQQDALGIQEGRSALEHSQSHSSFLKRRRSATQNQSEEYCVMIQNLPHQTTKTEIKGLFVCPHIPNTRVLHLLDKNRERTDVAFIVFDQKEEYLSALNRDGYVFYFSSLKVSPVSKENMQKMIHMHKVFYIPDAIRGMNAPKRPKLEECASINASPLTCIYMRNLPADIRKVEINDFFYRFFLSEDCIHILEDCTGKGVGEAVVKFRSEKFAKIAETKNGRNFLGVRVMLTLITEQQRKELLCSRS